MRAINLFKYNDVSDFHQSLKPRQKQVSLDSILVKNN